MRRIGAPMLRTLTSPALFDMTSSARVGDVQMIRARFQLIRTVRRCYSEASCSDSSSIPAPHGTIQLRFQRGLPVITVPLPSREEDCQFSLRPLSDTVGNLCESLKAEDRGLDHVALYTKEGVRISISTLVEHLLQFGTFRLRLNDKYYEVQVEEQHNAGVTSERIRELDDLRATVGSLHGVLCVDEYKMGRERRLLTSLEQAETELKPLHQKLRIEHECETHAERMMWAGFATMGIQTGVFARLTWWEYSWDIMEPVTYFATYSTVVATFGYYLYTKQLTLNGVYDVFYKQQIMQNARAVLHLSDQTIVIQAFDYPAARERVFTKQFYKRALKQGFDIERYNALVNQVEDIRQQLKRIRDPLFQHLPVSYLSKFEVDPTTAKEESTTKDR